MKTIITLLLALITSTAFGTKYDEVMKTNIEKMYKLTSSVELQELANQFERIGNAEADKWLPNYYAAYCFMTSTFFDNMEQDAKTVQLDKAQKLIDGLMKKNEKESEMHALQAFLYQLRINDMMSGAKYSQKAGDEITAAEKLNPQNPRVYYLRGSNTFHTPKFFGGGPENAKPDLEKAAGMFASPKETDPLMPAWGSVHNQQLLDQCKEAENK